MASAPESNLCGVLAARTRREFAVPRPARSSEGHHSRCNHMVMTRVYSEGVICTKCHTKSDLGFVYKCVDDREILLEHKIEHDEVDETGNLLPILGRGKVPRPRSAIARGSNKLEFLNEITEQEFKHYKSSQLRLILKQREHVLEVAKTSDSDISFRLFLGVGQSSTTTVDRPWIPVTRCTYTTCPSCKPKSSERCFLSIDGVLKGDYPATALTGWGHNFATWPYATVEMWKSLGGETGTPKNEENANPTKIAAQADESHKEAHDNSEEDLFLAASSVLLSPSEQRYATIASIPASSVPASPVFTSPAAAAAAGAAIISHLEETMDDPDELRPRIMAAAHKRHSVVIVEASGAASAELTAEKEEHEEEGDESDSETDRFSLARLAVMMN